MQRVTRTDRIGGSSRAETLIADLSDGAKRGALVAAPLQTPLPPIPLLLLFPASFSFPSLPLSALSLLITEILTKSGVSFCDDNSKVWYASSADDKISARRTGDWDCERWGALVYGSQDVCFRCGNPPTMVAMPCADLAYL